MSQDWESTESSASDPPAATLAWVHRELGEPVDRFEQLVGGISSAVHRLTLAHSGRSVVLRRYTLASWIEREPHIPDDEARNLSLIGSLGFDFASPELLAVDPTAQHCDVPALVMSEVAGAPDIDPSDASTWADKLATCLATMHAAPASEQLPAFRRWDRPGQVAPSWTQIPHVWDQAQDMIAGDLPAHPVSFLHRDFHPNNVHWLDGEIVAVVDWLSACNGPRAVDVSHCRWNLALLAAPEIAFRFTDRYRELTGYSEDLRAYDLSTVLSGPRGPFPTFAWNDLGRTDLTSSSVAVRIDQWLQHVMENQ